MAGAPAKPWWKRPLPLAGAGLALVILILIIALPASLVNNGGSSNNGGSGSSNSGTPTSGTMPSPTAYGCGATQSVGFSNDFTNQHLVSGDYTRNYSINIPPNYNDDLNKHWPVILDFHGNSRTGTDQYNNSMYYAYDGGLDYIAVYPEGVDRSWQGASYAVSDVDDIQFTSDLVTHLHETYCIDANRMYVSGKSNGGGFADLLACSDLGDNFAAFAMASAALYTDNDKSDCTKSRAIMESHGLDDTTIPYEPKHNSGNGGDLPDVRNWVKWWSMRDGCAHKVSAERTDEKGYQTNAYTCGDYDDVVMHYKVKDLDHCWPNAKGENFDAEEAKGCGKSDLDFTPKVLEFFGNWTLESAPVQS